MAEHHVVIARLESVRAELARVSRERGEKDEALFQLRGDYEVAQETIRQRERERDEARAEGIRDGIRAARHSTAREEVLVRRVLAEHGRGDD